VSDGFFTSVEVQPRVSALTIDTDPIDNDVSMGSGLALKLCVIVQHYYILIHIHPQSIK
jgi:hypothetical protein